MGVYQSPVFLMQGTVGGAPVPVGLDGVTNAMLFIDYEHHEIHGGSHYFYADDEELDNTGSVDYLLTVPDSDKRIHFTGNLVHTGVASMNFYRGADRVGTTLQTSYNNEHESLNTPGMTIHKGTSGGTTDGTIILPYRFGVSLGSNSSGGEIRNSREQVLARDTKYIIRLASETNGQLLHLFLTWYEHTSKI